MPQTPASSHPRRRDPPAHHRGLHGRPFPAPADYEPLLALIAGPGWRVPDPSFKYVTPTWLSRRLNGWSRCTGPSRKFWDTYTAPRAAASRPSPPPRPVGGRALPVDAALGGLGAGDLRDSPVVREVLPLRGGGRRLQRRWDAARAQARQTPAPRARQRQRQPAAALPRLPPESHEQPVDLYARFLLNTLDADGVANVLRLASMSLRRGGYLLNCGPSRTAVDQGLPQPGSGPFSPSTTSSSASTPPAAGCSTARRGSAWPRLQDEPRVSRWVTSATRPAGAVDRDDEGLERRRLLRLSTN